MREDSLYWRCYELGFKVCGGMIVPINPNNS